MKRLFRAFGTAAAFLIVAACSGAGPTDPVADHALTPAFDDEPLCYLIEGIWFCPDEYPGP